MRLPDYRAKKIFREYGIDVPDGRVKLDIEREICLTFMIDRSQKDDLLLASSYCDAGEGKIHKMYRRTGIYPDEMAEKLNLEGNEKKQVSEIISKLYKIYKEKDALLAEINPLVITEDKKVVAVEGEIEIDNNALYRHPEFSGLYQGSDPLEIKAEDIGINFTLCNKDGGKIFISNGNGLAMSTYDHANGPSKEGLGFIDLGGGAGEQELRKIMSFVYEIHPSIIYFNLFGGITDCDDVARVLLEYYNEDIPIIMRIEGRKKEEAKNIVEDTGIIIVDSFRELCEAGA